MADRTAKVSVSSSNTLSVDPETIQCGKRPGRDMDIQWHIATRGWKFTQNGIEHKDNDDQTFHGPQHSDFDFHWKNRNHHDRLYHYAVNVVSTDGKTTLTLDPAIQNRGASVGP
jgi:hypothetical protein